jgi:hypothetical protein
VRFPQFKLLHHAYNRYRLQQLGFSSYPKSFLVDSHSICSSYTHILFLEHRRPIRAQNSQILLFIPIFGNTNLDYHQLLSCIYFSAHFALNHSALSLILVKIASEMSYFGHSKFKLRHILINLSFFFNQTTNRKYCK